MKETISILICAMSFFSCAHSNNQDNNQKFEFSKMVNETDKTQLPADSIELATFGAGCFWCVEAIYQNVKGVTHVQSGYSGGSVKNPSYKEVCNGTTGHAEVCQITFNPSVVSYSELLEVFFGTHDPTTLNRQGADVGTQYRSAIFYHNEHQKEIGELAIKAANESGNWHDPIVTEVTAYGQFYQAEDYHDDYYNLHGEQPYCQMVITPKVDKFKKKFGELMKKP